jgi:hypothetical protein
MIYTNQNLCLFPPPTTTTTTTSMDILITKNPTSSKKQQQQQQHSNVFNWAPPCFHPPFGFCLPQNKN